MSALTWSRRRVECVALLGGVAVLLALRLPFLPVTLDDIDSVNFDLGVHDYDPVHHQPHPPGYPVYTALAKIVHGWFSAHASGLAFLSALFGALTIVPFYLLMRRLASWQEAALICVLTLFNPIVWFNGVRPMSDVTGFFFVTTTQWLLVAALADETSPSMRRLAWLLGSMLAGLSIGTRLQAVWLIGPVMLYGIWRLRSLRMAAATVLCAGGAVALWLVPVLLESGGPGPYLDSFGVMIRTSLPSDPLVNNFSIRRAAFTAVDVFLSPWQSALGVAIVLLAGVGGVILARSDRRLLLMVSLLFVPYAVYDYALQATLNLRYAIPIVPLVACLASVAVVRATRWAALLVPAAAAAAVASAAVVTLPALAIYHRTPSPPFQALAALERLDAAPGSIVVSGHHVFERYLGLVRDHQVLPVTESARQTLMEYWQGGGRKPVVFFRQAIRSTLLLFGHDRQQSLGRWRWPTAVRGFMQGERPGRIELMRLEAPSWFTEGGFLLSDEAGPIDEVVRQKPRLRVRPSPRRQALVISGFLRDTKAGDIGLNVRNRRWSTWHVGERFTLRTLLDPLAASDAYLLLSLDTSAPAVFTDVGLEPSDRPFIRPSHGFYTAERDEDTELFRWTAARAVATAYMPLSRARVTIEGAIPVEYYRLPLVLSFDWNGRPLGSVSVTGPRFRIEQPVTGSPDAPWDELAITSTQTFVPDERQRNGDRRTLGVRIYRLAIEPLS